MSTIAKKRMNTEQNTEKELSFNKSFLQGMGILEFLRTAAYGVSAVLVMTTANGAAIAKKVFNITEAANGMSIETTACITGAFIAVVSLLMGILLFKALKPGSKAAAAVQVLAFLSFIATLAYEVIYDFSISMTISVILDTLTFSAAQYLRKYNH